MSREQNLPSLQEIIAQVGQNKESDKTDRKKELNKQQKNQLVKAFIDAQHTLIGIKNNNDKDSAKIKSQFFESLKLFADNNVFLPGIKENNPKLAKDNKVDSDPYEITYGKYRNYFEVLNQTINEIRNLANSNQKPNETQKQHFLDTFLEIQAFTVQKYDTLKKNDFNDFLTKFMKLQTILVYELSQTGIELPEPEKSSLEKLDERFSKWRESTKMAVDKVLKKWKNRKSLKKESKQHTDSLFNRQESKELFGFDGALVSAFQISNQKFGIFEIPNDNKKPFLDVPANMRIEYGADTKYVVVQFDNNVKVVPGQSQSLKDKQPIIMGRIDEGSFQYDLGVSRQHAKVELKNGKPVITDLGSSNKTFALIRNGNKLVHGAEIHEFHNKKQMDLKNPEKKVTDKTEAGEQETKSLFSREESKELFGFDGELLQVISLGDWNKKFGIFKVDNKKPFKYKPDFEFTDNTPFVITEFTSNMLASSSEVKYEGLRKGKKVFIGKPNDNSSNLLSSNSKNLTNVYARVEMINGIPTIISEEKDKDKSSYMILNKNEVMALIPNSRPQGERPDINDNEPEDIQAHSIEQSSQRTEFDWTNAYPGATSLQNSVFKEYFANPGSQEIVTIHKPNQDVIRYKKVNDYRNIDGKQQSYRYFVADGAGGSQLDYKKAGTVTNSMKLFANTALDHGDSLKDSCEYANQQLVEAIKNDQFAEELSGTGSFVAAELLHDKIDVCWAGDCACILWKSGNPFEHRRNNIDSHSTKQGQPSAFQLQTFVENAANRIHFTSYNQSDTDKTAQIDIIPAANVPTNFIGGNGSNGGGRINQLEISKNEIQTNGADFLLLMSDGAQPNNVIDATSATEYHRKVDEIMNKLNNGEITRQTASEQIAQSSRNINEDQDDITVMIVDLREWKKL